MSAPERENLNDVLPASQVQSVVKSESEPSAVTLARLRNDMVQFVVVAIAATILVILVAVFLISIYPTATPEAQGKIVTAATTIISAAIGVFVGKKI